MKESALNFGPAEGLVGILARPTAQDAAAATPDPAVVFLNSGILHRVGPNRLHVRLARALAAAGVTSLRLDLPGIGDSRPPGTTATIADENLRAVRCAMDVLEARGIATRFALFGLCSGAGDAFRAACADPRVVGVVLVDPPTLFPTWRSTAVRVAGWAARPRSWYRLASGRYGILRELRARAGIGRPAAPAGVPADPAGAAGPSLSESKRMVEGLLPGLVARGVRICYVVTGDQRHVYNYRTQLLDSFPGLGLETVARLELFPEAVHTFPHEASRRRLEETVVDWVRTGPFPDPPAG